MLVRIFSMILETGLAASGMILLVFLLSLLLRRAPKSVTYVLWVAVFLRLLFPVELVSPVGLMPSIQLEESSLSVTGMGRSVQWNFPWANGAEVGRTAGRQEGPGLGMDGGRSFADREFNGGVGTNQGATDQGTVGQSITGQGTDGQSIAEQSAAGRDIVEQNTQSTDVGSTAGNTTYAQKESSGSEEKDQSDWLTGEKAGTIDIKNGLVQSEERGKGSFGLLDSADRSTGFVLQIAGVIWLCGVLAMAFYGLFQAYRLKRKLSVSKDWTEERLGTEAVGLGADHIGNRRIYVSDRISMPFVFGLLHPAVYLPDHLPKESEGYILLHEQVHIRHRDYLVKYAAYVLLCLYWFQPLIWLAFQMLERSMEYVCDEGVLARLKGKKKEYSQALLVMATGDGIGVGGLPVAFSQKNTKARIQNILDYTTPVKWKVAVPMVLVLLLAGCLMTSRGILSSDIDKGEQSSNTAQGEQISDAAQGEQESDQSGIPCLILDEKGRIVGNRRFDGVYGIDMEWSGYPGMDHTITVTKDSFAGCDSLETIVLPYGYDLILEEGAFAGCSDELVVCCGEDEDLPDRLEELGIEWMPLGEKPPQTTPHMLMTTQDEVVGVSRDWYYGSSVPGDTLESVEITFPEETKVIGEGVCSNYYGLGKVTIPARVTEIKPMAFNSTGLEEVEFQGNALKKIGSHAFMETGLKKIKLPEGLEEIGRNAFTWSKLKKITLPSSVKTVGDSWYGSLNLKEIIVKSRDVEYQGDHALPEEDVKIRCYPASTTQAYIQSNFLDVELELMEDETSPAPDDSFDPAYEFDPIFHVGTDGTVEPSFHFPTISQSREALDRERNQAAFIEKSTVLGQQNGAMTLQEDPWELVWWADVTHDGHSEKITVTRTSKKKKNFRVTIQDGNGGITADGSGIWSWEMEEVEWQEEMPASGYNTRRLGLYYQGGNTYPKVGKTYLIEWDSFMDKKKSRLSYRVFYLDGSREIEIAGENLEYRNKDLEDEEYVEKNNQFVDRAKEYLQTSDLIIGQMHRVMCSVPLQKRDMYGWPDLASGE